MRLPQLKVLQNETREAVSCTQHDYCSECKLYEKNGGRCEGCTPNHRAQLKDEFVWCYQECHSCTGYKANVTAVCCRSPLKNMYLDAVTQNPDDWNAPKYDYTERERLSFDDKAIFHFGNKVKASVVVGDALRKHAVVATNLKVVLKPSAKGFVSDDLHDYLSLSKKTKIILTTMDIDDHLERAWSEGFYDRIAEYERVGVSYWMPLAFSTYTGDAKMHSYYQFCRTQFATERSKPHFYAGYYRPIGLRLDDLHMKALEKIPQVMFNAQFLGSAKSENVERTLRFIAGWHELAPKKTAFWIVGASTPTFIHNVRRLCGKRDIYYVSSKPLYMTMWGQKMRTDGNERDLTKEEHPEKPELVHENYEMFKSIVNTYNQVRS